jgi:four helix bundle protein
MAQRHENLVAFRRADDLFIEVHRLTAKFPDEERYGLSSQLRRAAYSVPANIVEGMTRRTNRDRLRFLNIAESSLAEVSYCLHAAKRLGYIAPDSHAVLEERLAQVGAPLLGLMRSMKLRPERE